MKNWMKSSRFGNKYSITIWKIANEKILQIKKKGKLEKLIEKNTISASCSGKRGQSGSVIAIKSKRSLWTCSNVSQVLAQLAIEKMAVRSGTQKKLFFKHVYENRT